MTTVLFLFALLFVPRPPPVFPWCFYIASLSPPLISVAAVQFPVSHVWLFLFVIGPFAYRPDLLAYRSDPDLRPSVTLFITSVCYLMEEE